MKKDKETDQNSNSFPESNDQSPFLNNDIPPIINNPNNQTNISTPLTNVYSPISPPNSPPQPNQNVGPSVFIQKYISILIQAT